MLHLYFPPLPRVTNSRAYVYSARGVGGCRGGGNCLPRVLSLLGSSFRRVLPRPIFESKEERRMCIFFWEGCAVVLPLAAMQRFFYLVVDVWSKNNYK